MKKNIVHAWFLIGGVLLLLLPYTGYDRVAYGQEVNAQKGISLETLLRLANRSMPKKAPDGSFQMDRMSIEGDTLIYSMSILDKSYLSEAEKTIRQEDLAKAFCTQSLGFLKMPLFKKAIKNIAIRVSFSHHIVNKASFPASACDRIASSPMPMHKFLEKMNKTLPRRISNNQMLTNISKQQNKLIYYVVWTGQQKQWNKLDESLVKNKVMGCKVLYTFKDYFVRNGIQGIIYRYSWQAQEKGISLTMKNCQ